MEESAFERLAGETRRLFYQLRAAAEALHDDDRVTAAHRGVLESLYRLGPQTVPAMARARPVSRQHIQTLVNRLAALGLVEAQENPASRRSPLIGLTATGRRRIEGMLRREHRAVDPARLPVSQRRLHTAAETLRAVRE